jgi:peptidoglycan/LPS O-acetylase OafA/YrhL
VAVMHVSIINDTMTAMGASVLIVAALGSDRIIRWLRLPPVLALGRASYSFYLFHTLVVISFLCVLQRKIAVFPILLLAFIVILPVTAAAYLLFEVPSIQLGRGLSARIGRVRRRRAVAVPP